MKLGHRMLAGLLATAWAGAAAAAPPGDVTIDASRVYPESLTSDAAGNLYNGSNAGTIYRTLAGSKTAKPWIVPDAHNGLRSLFGVFADDNNPRFRDGKPWPDSIVDGVGGGVEAGYAMVNARTIFDAGGIIGYCTDTTYDALAGLEHELKSMNVVFSMQDMIKIMGPNTASYLGMEKDLGTLEAGKLADILLLDGDPLEGYWNWLKTKVTIKEGKIVVDKR